MKQLISVTCILFILFAIGQGDDQVVDASAPAPAPAPAPDCTDVVYDMINCVSYLAVGSDDKEPEETCCDALPLVLAVDKSCICVAVKDSIDMGVNLNLTRVQLLPSICKVAAPPLSSCGINLSPISPVSSAPANPPELAAPAEAPVNHHGNGSNPPASLGSKSPPTKPSTRTQEAAAAPSPSPSPAEAPIKAAANPILGFISSNLLFASFFCFTLV